MQYRELLPLLISHSLSRFMERNAEEAQSIFVPPRRRKYKLVDPIGKIALPHESRKILEKLALLYGLKDVEIAELILQAVLNSVPLVEHVGGDSLKPEEVVDLIADTMVLDETVHSTYDHWTAKQRKEKRKDMVDNISRFVNHEEDN